MKKGILIASLLFCTTILFAQKIITKQNIWKARKTTLDCKEGQKYLPFDATFYVIDSSNFKLEIYASGQKSEILVELTNLIRTANGSGNKVSTFECLMKMVVGGEENTEIYNGETTLGFHDNGKHFAMQLQMPNGEDDCYTNFQFVPKVVKKKKKK